MIYRLLRAILRHALWVYFRELEVEGREQVPAEGPLLLGANHPNTLIDVLLIATSLDRKVGFVAKATLFRSWVLGPILRFFGAVPVERRVDGPVDAEAQERNRRALEACEQAVAAGQAVLIFPEGVSQGAPRLLQLKTGLARIALAAEARAPGQVVVVPVALTYDRPEVFRSRARVEFGEPVHVAPFAAQARDAEEPDGFAAARALTEAVREALEEDVVHVEAAAHEGLIRQLDTIYGRRVEAEVGGRLAATAVIARALNEFARTEPERVERVRGHLSDYCRRLEEAGIDDRVVRARAGRQPSALEDLAFYLGAPLALWGIVNHAVYYQLPRLVVRLTGPDRLYASTVKLVVGLAGLVLCYGLQTWGVWELTGELPALIYLGTLPITGLVALLWAEGLEARRRAARARRRFGSLAPEQAQELVRRREELIRELDLARAEYLTRRLRTR